MVLDTSHIIKHSKNNHHVLHGGQGEGVHGEGGVRENVLSSLGYSLAQIGWKI